MQCETKTSHLSRGCSRNSLYHKLHCALLNNTCCGPCERSTPTSHRRNSLLCTITSAWEMWGWHTGSFVHITLNGYMTKHLAPFTASDGHCMEYGRIKINTSISVNVAWRMTYEFPSPMRFNGFGWGYNDWRWGNISTHRNSFNKIQLSVTLRQSMGV